MTTTSETTTWVCYNCGERNDYRVLTCAVCSHERYATGEGSNEPVTRPPFYAVKGFVPLVIWGGLAVGGLSMLLFPNLRHGIGISWILVLLETLVTTSAAFTAAVEFIWNLHFRRVDILLPELVAAKDEVEVSINLVPYSILPGVSIQAEVLDRFFTQDPQSGAWQKHARAREFFEVARNQTLPGGRVSCFAVRFPAPYPSLLHENLSAEITASVLALFTWLVPGLSQAVRSLRHHGGFYVRVRVYVGPFRRTFERRFETYLRDGHMVVL